MAYKTRHKGLNPRAKGTNPRALGTNPRSLNGHSTTTTKTKRRMVKSTKG